MENISYYNSPFGVLSIKDDGEKITLLKNLGDTFKTTKDSKISLKLKAQLDEYFAGKRKIFNINYELKATDFQKKVWQALSEIPYATTKSYKDIALQIGKPKGSRAVGLACNKNPILIIIPCHRVIASSGNLLGYAGGLSMKEGLLMLEKNKDSILA